MARLPSGRYLAQHAGDDVIVFEEGTEREVMRVPLVLRGGDGSVTVNKDGIAEAQAVIYHSELGDEDRAFAHFWCGYFYAHAARDTV
jgi:hypothetical protein